MSNAEFTMIDMPTYNYKLEPLGEENIRINLVDRPNCWTRFWMFIFFNWRFQNI